MPRVLLARLRRLPLLAAVCAVVSCPVAGCSAPGGGGPAPGPSPASAGPTIHLPSRARPSPTGVAPAGAVPVVAGGPARLASQLTAAETVLAEGDAPPALMARQALIVQLACLRVAAHPGWASVVTRRVAPARRAAAGADIAATADLVALTQPRPRLPPWRIVAAENPATLLADYRAAQAATGVGWSYLAAVNFVETDFGRVAGPSSAGAQGPMQFMPATWAVYGHGNIHRPRNAILAAGRFLAGSGAARQHRLRPVRVQPELAVRRRGAALRAPAARRPAGPDGLLPPPGGLPPGQRVGSAARRLWHRPGRAGHPGPYLTCSLATGAAEANLGG